MATCSAPSAVLPRKSFRSRCRATNEIIGRGSAAISDSTSFATFAVSDWMNAVSERCWPSQSTSSSRKSTTPS